MTCCAGCDERDEKIRQLEHELYGRDWYPPGALNLTHTEAAMLQALVAAGERFLTREFLLEARRSTGGYTKAEPDPKLIDVKLSHLRTKLKQHGMTLETKYGFGWRLSAASRSKLCNWHDRRAA